jgi:hypothetical protein
MTQWAVIVAPSPAVITASSPSPHDDQEARPILTADAVFHPPRLTTLVG